MSQQTRDCYNNLRVLRSSDAKHLSGLCVLTYLLPQHGKHSPHHSASILTAIALLRKSPNSAFLSLLGARDLPPQISQSAQVTLRTHTAWKL